MALTVQIQKRLPEFTLDVSFCSVGSAPVGVLGPSGAGKSILLKCIAGVERPDRGRVMLGETVLFDSDQHVQIPARARRVGMLFQNYSLFPHMTVARNIAFGVRSLTPDASERRVTALLEQMHIRDLGSRYPRELSGGEQQRVALARALAIEPEALLLDEPLSALDAHLHSQLEIQLQETLAGFQRPTLIVTHDIDEAYRLGNDLMLLARGRVLSFGPKEEVFRHPPTREAAQITGCKNLSRARWVGDHEIEALDWGCRLKIADTQSRGAEPVAFAGIRAHHVDFLEAGDSRGTENVFPCWPLRTSETPFRVTVYLHLHQPPHSEARHHLQAEVFNEKWQKFRDCPLPWHVRLSPDVLFVMPE